MIGEKIKVEFICEGEKVVPDKKVSEHHVYIINKDIYDLLKKATELQIEAGESQLAFIRKQSL